ncbi:MAG: hypothetical protein IPO12_01955 [Flavobacteriales bacterium]|nr:hypothetical protein [Flavobacteriales bacterium]
MDAPLAARDSIAEEGWDLSGREYGMLYEAPLYTVRAPNDVLEVLLDATVLDEPALDLELVLELHSTIGAGRDTIHFYRSMSARTCAVRWAREEHWSLRYPLRVVLWPTATCVSAPTPSTARAERCVCMRWRCAGAKVIRCSSDCTSRSRRRGVSSPREEQELSAIPG